MFFEGRLVSFFCPVHFVYFRIRSVAVVGWGIMAVHGLLGALLDCCSLVLVVAEVSSWVVEVQPRDSIRSSFPEGLKAPSGAAMWMVRVPSGLRAQVKFMRRYWPVRKAKDLPSS